MTWLIETAPLGRRSEQARSPGAIRPTVPEAPACSSLRSASPYPPRRFHPVQRGPLHPCSRSSSPSPPMTYLSPICTSEPPRRRENHPPRRARPSSLTQPPTPVAHSMVCGRGRRRSRHHKPHQGAARRWTVDPRFSPLALRRSGGAGRPTRTSSAALPAAVNPYGVGRLRRP